MRVVFVKYVDWKMDPLTAKIYPIFKFPKIKVGEKEFNHAPFPNITKKMIKRLESGESVYVHDIMFKIDKTVFFAVPEKCPECGGEVKYDQDMMFCTRKLCSGKSLTCIHKLLDFVDLEEISLEVLENYLTVFPLNHGNHTNILHVLEKQYALVNFLTLFKQIGPKDIASRRNEVARSFGKHGADLSNMEYQLDLKLRNGFTFAEFWYILNLPGIDDIVAADKLTQLDPRRLSELLDSDEEYRAKEMLDKLDVDANVNASIFLLRPYWMQVLNRISLKTS